MKPPAARSAATGRRSGRRNHAAFGSDRERKVKALLEAEGWRVVRASGSFGVCDLIAMRGPNEQAWDCGDCAWKAHATDVRLIEVKGTARSPWVAWGPKERGELLQVAREIRATPLLCWWPPHGAAQWLGEAEWP